MASSEKDYVTVGDITFRFKDEYGAVRLNPTESLGFGLNLDRLKTLIVKEDVDALSLSNAIDASDISHVLVRGVNEEISGVIVVDWVKQQVAARTPGSVNSFADAVNAVLKMGPQSGSYHHEWLTVDRPPSFGVLGFGSASHSVSAPTYT